jgi:hypothetical protein
MDVFQSARVSSQNFALRKHVRYANLLMTLAEFADADVEKIGHSTGRLSL